MLRLWGLLSAAILGPAGISLGNTAPEAVAATSTVTDTATPNNPGEELSFDLRWEETGTANGIITGSITFPADTVANPPLFTSPSAAVPGSTLIIRHEGILLSWLCLEGELSLKETASSEDMGSGLFFGLESFQALLEVVSVDLESVEGDEFVSSIKSRFGSW